jgi:hypothetical protein
MVLSEGENGGHTRTGTDAKDVQEILKQEVGTLRTWKERSIQGWAMKEPGR